MSDQRSCIHLALAAAVAIALGCERRAEPADTSSPTTSSTGNESSTDDAELACPTRFDEAGPGCDASALELRCDYPEGLCFCGQPRECSGVMREPEPPRWVCEPHLPECPPPGGSCEGDAVCAPWCCGMGVVCVDGRWTERDFPCPP